MSAPDRVVEDVAAAVLAHPGIARLDGGPFGTVASHLPGRRRVVGVRVGVGDEPVQIAVVARLGVPLPQLATEVGAAVRGVLGPVAVEVTFSDVVAAVTAAPVHLDSLGLPARGCAASPRPGSSLGRT